MSKARKSVNGLAASPFDALLHIDQSVLDAIPSAVYVCAADGTIVRYNRTAVTLWGRRPRIGATDEKFCGSFRLRHLDGRSMPHADTPMAETLRIGAPQHGEVAIERPDGSRVVVKVDIEPLKGPHGELQGAINCFSDITDRKQNEKVLADRVKELGVLYGFVEKLYRARSRAGIYEAALDAITGALDCSRASILLVDEAGVMRFAAARGLSDGYRAAVEGHTPWAPDQPDPEPILVEDIDETDEPEALKSTIRAEGIRGLAFFPLVIRSGLVGKFMTYYDTPHVFTGQEIDLAVSIARQLGFSIERLQAEEERSMVEQELRQNEERLRLASAAGKVGLWDCDLVGDRVSWTDSMYTIHGMPKQAFDGTVTGFASVVHAEDRARVHAAIDRALEAADGFEIEFQARRQDDGTTVWLHATALILREDGGRPVRMIGATVDVTDRREAEARLRERTAQLETVMETVPAVIWIAHDTEALSITGNRFAAEFLKLPRDVNQSLTAPAGQRPRHFRVLRDGAEVPPEDLPLQRAARGEEIRDDEVQIVFSDGTSRWELVNAAPVRDASGAPAGSVGVAVDITERKLAEEHRQLLIDELNHRVKNTLAIVQGIAQLTFAGEKIPQEKRTAFEGRLTALGSAHSLLTQSNWERAFLHELVLGAISGCGTEARDRTSFGGPPVVLQARQAGTVAMALHELCANAMKYGALSNDSGTVSVEWQIAPGAGDGSGDGADDGGCGPRLRLAWRESGGPAVSPPRRRGFGSRIIEQALAQDLGAKVALDFRPDGLVCTVDARLPDLRGAR